MLKGPVRMKVEILRNIIIQTQMERLIGTEVRVNGFRENKGEKLLQLLKSKMEVRVAHGFNSNKNTSLIQKGGTCT